MVALVPSGSRKRACTLALVTGLNCLSRTSTRIGTVVSSLSTDLGRGGDHLPRRVGHQVAEHLLPEGGVGLVGVVEPHLPAPASLGGEQHGAAAAVILGHQQRLRALARRRHFAAAWWRPASARRHPGSWPSAESSSSVRRCAPDSRPGGRSRSARPARVSATLEKSRWKVPRASGSLTGTRSAMGEFCQPPSLKRGAPADEQQAAAAPVHEIVNRLLLRRA